MPAQRLKTTEQMVKNLIRVIYDKRLPQPGGAGDVVIVELLSAY